MPSKTFSETAWWIMYCSHPDECNQSMDNCSGEAASGTTSCRERKAFPAIEVTFASIEQAGPRNILKLCEPIIFKGSYFPPEVAGEKHTYLLELEKQVRIITIQRHLYCVLCLWNKKPKVCTVNRLWEQRKWAIPGQTKRYSHLNFLLTFKANIIGWYSTLEKVAGVKPKCI